MKRFFILAITALSGLQAAAQLELGIFGGVANYHGDLVEQPFKKPGAAFGISASYKISSRFNLRAGLTFAKVQGADSLSSQPDLKARNLSFQSPVNELSLVAEFNTLDMDVKSWSPYVFAGLSLYRFNPYTFDASGNKIFLQPLGTEGQGLPGYEQPSLYNLTQLAIPFGAGIKYQLNPTIRLSLELGMRKLFTDYLDDVSGNYADPAELLANRGQTAVDLSYRADELPGGDPVYPAKGETRGSPKFKDYFYFSGLHIHFALPEGNGGAGRKGYGCPTVF